jgi:hypothetical protein
MCHSMYKSHNKVRLTKISYSIHRMQLLWGQQKRQYVTREKYQHLCPPPFDRSAAPPFPTTNIDSLLSL